MIEVSYFDALYINIILKSRQKMCVVSWLLLCLQVAEVGAS